MVIRDAWVLSKTISALRIVAAGGSGASYRRIYSVVSQFRDSSLRSRL